MTQKFLFLNLPANDKLTRRFMCSYQSPTSLFPPIELMSLAAVYRQTCGKSPFVLDAVADNLSVQKTAEFIAKNNITHLVSLIGFECFEEDIDTINFLKQKCQATSFIVFGHYPTLFAQEILDKSSVDKVLVGEPEELLVDALNNGTFDIAGKQIISKQTSSSINQNRIKEFNSLPAPAYDLISHRAYHEPMMARPFGLIQSARGCPYSCNYCVKSFGTRLTLRSPESIIDEITILQKLHGIKGLRFIDDTFTVNKQRVLAICHLIVQHKINIEWSCLSRTDNVDEEMLMAMKKTGCKRIYYGIESGSQRILDFYKKGIRADEALEAVKLTGRCGIESSGFFMLGLPQETEDDFLLTKAFIAEAGFDYIGIGGLVLYPGTPLFDLYKDDVEFSLFPYVNRFKDTSLQKRYLKWNKELYDSFLYSGNFVKKFSSKIFHSPLQAFDTFSNALSYQITYRKGVFHHIQKHKNTLNYSG